LHTLILILIVVIVPALGADTIAREKRDGTLGLLFLTSLSASGIVGGKLLAQTLRVFTLWLAVLPILIIPFTLGGVTWYDAGCALSIEFSATVLCLAAGLLASTLARERNTAFILALVLGGAFLLLFDQFDMLILFFGFIAPLKVYKDWWELSWALMTVLAGLDETDGMYAWAGMKLASPKLDTLWECLCLTVPILALIFLRIIMRFATRRIERSWQDQIPSARRLKLLRRYCTPLFQNRFRQHTHRTLDRNPIVWLQQYSWKARVSKWGLCLAFVVAECFGAGAYSDDFQSLQFCLLIVLAGFCTFAGVNGFMAEKRSGALELLLTTPLPVNSIILGRSWGLWKQFFPAGLILISFEILRSYHGALWLRPFLSWLVSESGLLETPREQFINGLEMICGFLALPFCATYFALRVKNLFVAAILTWVALLIPPILSQECCIMFNVEDDIGPYASLLLLSNVGLILLVCFLLRHSLSRRIYSF
jgi:ABC-type transport system involved in multi-copper enzyme maturation permease subunit